jgi:hypothetical protein
MFTIENLQGFFTMTSRACLISLFMQRFTQKIPDAAEVIYN